MPQRFDISALLLCGGRSRRLGYPKEMLRVDGAPLAAQMTRRLRRLFPNVAVVSNKPEFLEPFVDAPIHRDAFPGAGPLAGLHAGLQHCRTNRCFVLACDMPLASDDLIRDIVARAQRSSRDAVIPAGADRLQPLCGVYSTALLDSLERFMTERTHRPVFAYLDRVDLESFDVGRGRSECFQDIDAEEDLNILRRVFDDVEPLPVRRLPMQSPVGSEDLVAEEWPVSLRVNGEEFAEAYALPLALRELALGAAIDRGLARGADDVERVAADYAGRWADVRLASSPPPRRPDAPAGEFAVSARHILDVLESLRAMAPVFCRTGATHQAAFSDGRAVRLFFEDVGRHNAVDKVIGRAAIEKIDLRRGVLFITGRINAALASKAIRQGVRVMASKAAVTSEARRVAERAGMTLVGFAREGRLNVYVRPDRIV